VDILTLNSTIEWTR